MLARVLVDQTVGATGCDGGREDPFPFVSGPVAWFFAHAEGLDGSGGQGSLGGLRQFVFGFTAAGGVVFSAASVAATTAAATVMTRSTSRTTPVKVPASAGRSGGGCTIIISRRAMVAVSSSTTRGIPIGIIIVVIRTVRPRTPGRRTLLHGRRARMARIVVV